MRSVFIVLSLAVAANAYSYGYGLTAEWETFKDTYNKEYSAQDEQFRFKVFTDNFNFIEQHNQKFDQGLYTYDLKMNHLGDMMNHEINNVLNGYRGVGSDEDALDFIEPDEDVILPRHVNWTKKGVVTPVKNQGECGSCWAFSATGSLEGQHSRKYKKLVSLSEQQLVDCSISFGNMGCLGGLMDSAFSYIKSNKGIDTETSYPYTAREGDCEFKKSAVAATDKGYVDIKHYNEKALQAAVATIGPISAAMDASQTSYHFYHSGIYSDPECSSTMLDHGVLVVGYGNLQEKEYWIVKNSWGTTWGLSGYFLLARNDNNMCGIASNASYPLVAKKHRHPQPMALDYDY